MSQIVLKNVGKRWADGSMAVDAFSLEVAAGEFIVLVGPSGCGKSTLLNMVAGLEDITAGTITIDGRVVNDLPPRDRDIAMVFQSYALYPHMTVRQNIGFPLKVAGMDEDATRRKVAEVAEMLELTAHLDRRPAKLSGGQRQRVAMGRAIVRRPRAFLMDEPLSNLDARLRVEMRRQVARIQKTLGTTTLYVTHDQTEAMTLGDRVVVMRRGVIQQVGSPRELYGDPANLFVAGFIGSPAMNFLPATITGETVRSPLGDAPLPDRLQRCGIGGEAILGIRPEDFEDATLASGRSGGFVTASIDAVEPTGSDLLAYFTIPGGRARSPELSELEGDAGSGGVAGDHLQVVTRLSAASTALAGQSTNLWYDTRRIHLFDPTSGANLARTRV